MDLTPGRSLLLSRVLPHRSPPDHGWAYFERVIAPAGDVAVVPRTYTAQGLSRDEWVRTRHAAAARALEARGLSPEVAWWVAIALMGHWANETGWGRAEIDYALGNIRARSDWTGPVHYLQGTDDPNPAPYRAYTSLDDGVEEIYFCRASSPQGNQAEVHGRSGELVSLIPWGAPVEGVRTDGLRWPLSDETLYPNKTRGISNELLGEQATVRIRSGLLLVVHRRATQER